MNRRSFVRTALTALGAAVGALALGEHAEAATPPLSGQLVQGPDPDHYVYVEWGPDGRIAVMPPRTPSPWPDQMVKGRGIPRTEFPEFAERHGVVFLETPLRLAQSDLENESIRMAYAVAVARNLHTSLTQMDADRAAILRQRAVDDAARNTAWMTFAPLAQDEAITIDFGAGMMHGTVVTPRHDDILGEPL